MYFEAGKVWGLGIVGDCGKGLVSSYSEAFDAAEVFSHRSYKIFIIWHKKKVNFRIFWCSARGRVTRSGKFDCVSSFCSCDPFETLFSS